MHASPIDSRGNLTWELPTRGRVGMFCLIAAESAIFVIFVVAYLFYLGKSLTGPTPAGRSCRSPIFFTICLLSSSLTIHLAVRALRQADIRAFQPLVVGDDRAWRRVPLRNRAGMVPADLRGSG